jgi:hypothetical protein
LTVWPLNAKSHRECLRIGASAVERWHDSAQGLVRIDNHALPGSALDQPECLADAIASLYPTPAKHRVSVVLESYWLPLMLADTGDALWPQEQVHHWLRHKFTLLYGQSEDTLQSWNIRADFLPGKRYAVGYGLPPHVQHHVLQGALKAGVVLRDLNPAWVWGWQRFRSQISTRAQALWWLWPEQDRQLVARLVAGRPVALNTAVPLGQTPPEIDAIVATETVRWGVQAQPCPVHVAVWTDAAQHPASTEQLRWHPLVALP